MALFHLQRNAFFPVPPIPPLPHLSFILGGARSGKSSYAQLRAENAAASGGKQPALIYVATAQAGDAEMAERILRHQSDRGARWKTLEAPLELADALTQTSSPDQIAVVDCLTLWLSNLIHAGRDVKREGDALLRALSRSPNRIILISNETGLGIVPDNALARQFRDHAGRLHQKIAAQADQVFFIAAGLPLQMK